MKKYIALVLFLLSSIQVFSQDNPQDKFTPEMREKFKNFKGTITGFVIDKDTKAPIAAVTVQIFKQKDSSLAGGIETDAAGKFILNNVKAGRYKLVASFAGYKKAVMTDIMLTPQTPELVLDTIKMSTGVTTEQIDVTAEKSFIEFKPDKKVFNVEKGMSTTGGNAIDVLKNIPGVTVDQDNNISFRGSGNIKVMIDGRPFGLNSSNISTILEQMPADKISSIELMTNPTAKFDAEGSSGMINIVLKKNDMSGMNGSVSASIGNGDKYNSSLTLNKKTKDYNLSGSYDMRLFNMTMNGFNNRELFGSSTITDISQRNENNMRMEAHNVRTGFDWTLNQKQNLGLNFSFNSRSRNRNGNSFSSVFSGSTLTSDYLTREYNLNDGKTYSVGANFLNKFDNPKHTLTGDFSYAHTDGNVTLNSFNDYTIPATPESKMNQFNTDKNDEVSFQLDYVNPSSEDKKFEAGVKSIYRKINDDNRTENYSYSSNSFVTDTSLSNIFNYQEIINSAYIAYTDKIGNFGYQIGLRGEQTNTKGEQITQNSSFTKSYFSLFPNISLSQKLGLTEELQLSYSRRIRRPDIGDLNPFLNTSDPLNYQSGNPDLDPEFINSLEFNFVKYFTSAIITPSLYFRQINDKISRVRIPYDSVITLATQKNFSSSRSYGFEVTVNATPYKIWMLNGTIGYSKTENDATNLTGQTSSAYSWNGRLFTSLNLPEDFGIQATYFYTGANLSAQGRIDPFSNAELSLKKDFLSKQLSVSFRVSDIFNSQKFHGTISDATFYDEFERKRDSRTVFLSVTYKFGSEMSRDRKKRRDNNEPVDMPDGF